VNIPGADHVTKVFGRWPSFHDAEVVRFLLERAEPYGAGPSILADIHAFERTAQVGGDGVYVPTRHTLISFRFGGVEQVKLDGFNNQNVLWDLTITDIRDRQIEGVRYEIHFASTFGMGAQFLSREATIEAVRPWAGRGESAG